MVLHLLLSLDFGTESLFIDFNEAENFKTALSLIASDNRLKEDFPNKNFHES